METYQKIKEICENVKYARAVTIELEKLLAEKGVVINANHVLAVECSYYEHRGFRTATIDIYMSGLTVKVLYDSDRESEDYRVVVAKDSFECYCGK
ncbi:MAG: hypothetical protein QW607_06205 [Desulfurococcaceae archaeon]